MWCVNTIVLELYLFKGIGLQDDASVYPVNQITSQHQVCG